MDPVSAAPIDAPHQPAATSGLRIDHKANDGLFLAVILDELDLGSDDLRWELTCVSVVWWVGNESPWDDSWNENHPLVLSDGLFRQQATDITQVINGRFSASRDGAEIVVVEAIDSTFWLVWSDDANVLVERHPA